jgi:hypothetical protein
MGLYCGVDLHSTSSYLAVLDLFLGVQLVSLTFSISEKPPTSCAAERKQGVDDSSCESPGN